MVLLPVYQASARDVVLHATLRHVRLYEMSAAWSILGQYTVADAQKQLGEKHPTQSDHVSSRGDEAMQDGLRFQTQLMMFCKGVHGVAIHA